ncbi:NAD(P)H-binding protein [Sphingobium vermicomposti]|uniref:NAD(P)H dehydrogenase (Quinone) n=1 Tax=Sphingobium vermicomposti TaxID=529005 RepID=A0A846MHV3_9SPHN|nr:NAD(P)H-binding protein [Sphingobium vermicomposti]NIJ17916.1 NAD(P)H dehydrogenase (quinone) [Sphingobium vermicomposti]
MKIGVSGASGHLGEAVLKRLKELPGSHTVAGISRLPHAVKYADEVRFGDYDAPVRLHEAYADLDRLLIIPTFDLRHGARARQLVHAIDAALLSGAGHITLISDVGTDERKEPHVGAASWVAEQHLIRSAPSWTILRANYFMESYAQEVLRWGAVGRLVELGENRVGFVSRWDVAAAAAGILVGAGHSGAFYNATGPEALTVADRAALASKILDKPVEIVLASPTELRQQLKVTGLSEVYLGVVMDIKHKTFEAGYDIMTGDVERLSGCRPKSLSDILLNSIA